MLVLDALTRKHFYTQPENLTVERDFNRIDIAGIEPDALERALGVAESQICDAVRRTLAGQRFASDDDKSVVAQFAAALMIRNPRFRGLMAQTVEDALRITHRLQVANNQRPYDAQLRREFFIGQELKLLELIPAIVAQRNWRVLIASDTSGGFVTGDHPATLTWTDPKMWSSPYGPGLGMTGTLVLLPLSTRIAVAGGYEFKDGVITPDDRHVAAINGVTILGARRQVYCEGPTAKYTLKNDTAPRGCMSLLNDQRFRAEKPPLRP